MGKLPTSRTVTLLGHVRFEAFAVSFLPTAGPTLSSTRGAWCKWPEKAIVDKQLQSGQTNGFTTFYKSLWESLPVVFQIGSHQRPTGELCVLVQLTHASDLQATWWDERFQWTIFAYVIYNHIQYTYIIFRNIYIYTYRYNMHVIHIYIFIHTRTCRAVLISVLVVINISFKNPE